MDKPVNVVTSKALEIGYGKTTVAKNINFSVAAGELCAIVGINGIGKSTLLRTLGHLQPKISGEIWQDAEQIEALKPEALARKISVVLTEPLASKNLSVVELIALGRQPYTNWIGSLTEKDKQHVQASMAALELTGLKERKCHELSDGQLQRALIARAMAQDTPTILLDEPTSHLDLHHKVQILKLLKELADIHHKTIIFTTHEIDLAIELCDKILVLNGKSNCFGKPHELIAQGAFDAIFPSETIQFDAQSGSFRIRK